MNGRQLVTKSRTLSMRVRLAQAQAPSYHRPIPEGYHAVDDFCQFRKLVPYTERTWYPDRIKGSSVRMMGPAYGDPPRNQAIKRCPLCGKRLRLRAVFCVGGEFIQWELPDHKPRETRKPGPKRQSRRSGRGK